MTFLALVFLSVLLARRDKVLVGLVLSVSTIIGASILVLDTSVGSAYYTHCAIFEVLIIICCATFRRCASVAVALMSLNAIVWHLLAQSDFDAGVRGHYWVSYPGVIWICQAGQILAFWIFNPPVLGAIDRFVSRSIFRYKEKKTWVPKTQNSG